MSVKSEIQRRLRKPDYIKMAKNLYDKSFDDLNGQEYTNILKIADIYGSKYKKIYKLKNDVDIRTITSNLVSKAYSPTYTTHFDLRVIGIAKSNNSFTIYTEFYTTEEILVDVTVNNKEYKEKQKVNYRRTMVLEKPSDTNYLVISIDRIGEGANVYKKQNEHLATLNEILELNLNDFFDTIEIEQAIYKLIQDDKLVPNKLIAKDETTNRLKSVVSQVARDNIKDDDIYDECESNDLKLENIKMKFFKETIELYGKTLLKISTTANKKMTDELTENIISVL